jgi:uncharacterized protein YbcC (UPF0753/DUF2309 family)
MPIKRSVLRARIETAAEVIGPLWPLQTFNAGNPLAGFEDRSFGRAVEQARQLFGGRAYPSAAAFRQAWENGEIDPLRLARVLDRHGIEATPEALLERMADDRSRDAATDAPADEPLDRAMTKWLAAFLDQGQAAWPMPRREEGFYAAWRAIAPHDGDVPGVRRTGDLPATPLEAFEAALEAYPEARWEGIFRHHLAALPGWTGFIKWRAQRDDDLWQQAHPIALSGYLAVRLTAARAMGQTVAPDDGDPMPADGRRSATLPALWLEAWEETYRQRLLETVRTAGEARPGEARPGEARTNGAVAGDGAEGERPAAQLAFCIDVRSEVIRRHLEATGPYETFGYAGFFGVPMQHERHDGVRVQSCPPIVSPKHRIADRVDESRAEEAERHDWWARLAAAGRGLVKSLKDNVAAAFGFVEGSGAAFGAAMIARTLLPSALFRLGEATEAHVGRPDRFCVPTVDRAPEADEEGRLPVGLSREAKIVYAEAAFRLMGWTDGFAPIVVFTGHGTQTPNNPYKASLDCGACAGNPGGPNARVLAAICNDDEVRAALRERGIDVPADTVFLAGQHNTTTDAVTLFVDEDDPPVAPDALERLQEDLRTAQAGAAAERVETMNARRPGDPVAETRRRAADWAETRPEWGLAGNAAFIIAPRRLTRGVDLDGRCFLHSYDWRADDDGTSLETIMTGPLVVGEWINTQYYFSTVDNAAYGSGSKVTQNVVGKIGVVQGNGGDLMSGLPLQSLRADDVHVYHRPLRLMALVQAPVGRVEAILERQAALRRLFDNEWVALTVMDPEQNGAVRRYRPGGTWEPAGEPAPEAAPDRAGVPA